MRNLIYMLTALILASCDNNSSTDNPTQPQEKATNTFTTCFANIDTSKTGQTIGCSGWTYKLINDKYVICILPNGPVQFDSCYTLTIDSSNAGLLVFDNKDAHLANICTDVIITNNPTPTRHLYAQSGKIIVGFSDPTELYGNATYHTTVLIKRIVFVDNKTGGKIELENELLWKVKDLGTPG